VIQLPQFEEVEDNQSLSPNKKTRVYIFEGEQGKRDNDVSDRAQNWTLLIIKDFL
jgi:hypothetical protein